MAGGSSFKRVILVKASATMVAALLMSSAPATAATTILPIAISSMCVAASMFEPTQAPADPLASSVSKAQTILGGAPSKLDLIRARHDGITSPAPQIDTLAAGFETMPGLGLRPFCGDPKPARVASVQMIQPLPPVPSPQFVAPPQFVAAIAHDRPDIFGSVALKISTTPLSARWTAARSASLGTRHGPWAPVLQSVRRQDRPTQIAAINSWVNARIRFVDDRAGHGRADHWASAAQSLRSRTGDCEDYAIAKMQMLKALGVADEDLYFVIARDLVRHADHALLVVRLDGRLVVLDNETDRLLDAAQTNDYRPVFTYAGTQAWTHGYRAQPVARPMQTASLTMTGFGPD